MLAIHVEISDWPWWKLRSHSWVTRIDLFWGTFFLTVCFDAANLRMKTIRPVSQIQASLFLALYIRPCNVTHHYKILLQKGNAVCSETNQTFKSTDVLTFNTSRVIALTSLPIRSVRLLYCWNFINWLRSHTKILISSKNQFFFIL